MARPQESVGHGTALRRAAGAAILVWIVLLLGAADAQAVPSVTFKCTPAPQDCSGWFRSDVAIDWTVIPSDAAVTGCQDKSFTTDTPGTNEFCSADDGTATVTVQLKIKVDQTAPVVTGGQPARAADINGWYNHAVPVTFAGSDLTSGIAACTATTYGGPDSATATIDGTCIDQAGNTSAPLGYGLKYDETPPAVTAAQPDRPPDHGSWFTAPVRLDLRAIDATSGLAACPSVMYDGPDAPTVSVTGTCLDRAGNASSRAFPLSFDATPPLLKALSVSPGDRRVLLRWRATGGVASAEVLRSPGRAGAPTTVVFRGPGARFADDQLVNGARYTYEVRVRDAAGNVGSRTVTAMPGLRLLAPAQGAVVEASEPPMLRWTPVRRARYYNVQVFRDGHKVLSAWPERPRLQLRHRWRYRGKRVRFLPGEYRWLVWPGHGARSKADYGERLGRRTFTVTR